MESNLEPFVKHFEINFDAQMFNRHFIGPIVVEMMHLLTSCYFLLISLKKKNSQNSYEYFLRSTPMIYI